MIWLYVAAGAVFLTISICMGIGSTVFGYFIIIHDPLHIQLRYPLILDYEPFAKISLDESPPAAFKSRSTSRGYQDPIDELKPSTPSSSSSSSGWTYRNMPSTISKSLTDLAPGLDEDSLIFINPPRPHSAVSWTHIGNNNTQPLIDEESLKRMGRKAEGESNLAKIIRRSNETMVHIQFDYDRFTANKKWWDTCSPLQLCEDDHPVKLITVHATVYDSDGRPYAASNVAHHATPTSWAQLTFCKFYRDSVHMLTAALPVESLVDYIIDLGWCRTLVRQKILLFPRLRLERGSEYFRIRITSNVADPAGHYALMNPTLLLDVSTGGLRGFIRRHAILVSLFIGFVASSTTFIFTLSLMALYAISNAGSASTPANNSRQAARIRHRFS